MPYRDYSRMSRRTCIRESKKGSGPSTLKNFTKNMKRCKPCGSRLKLSMISALTDRRYGVCARGIYFSNTAPVSGVVKRLNDTRQCSAP